MEIKNDKTLYEAPSTTVFEVKTEGVICTSPTLQDYNWNDVPEE